MWLLKFAELKKIPNSVHGEYMLKLLAKNLGQKRR
jgi:hypothetical protein